MVPIGVEPIGLLGNPITGFKFVLSMFRRPFVRLDGAVSF